MATPAITPDQRERLDGAWQPGLSASHLARAAGVQKAVALVYVKQRLANQVDAGLTVPTSDEFTTAADAFLKQVWDAAVTATLATVKAHFEAQVGDLADRLAQAELERDDAVAACQRAIQDRDRAVQERTEALAAAERAHDRSALAEARIAAAEAKAGQADELMRTVMADNRSLLEHVLEAKGTA